MTNQELYDMVVTRMNEQGGPSRTPNFTNCRYRGAGGRSCAVGCLIKDEFYAPCLEKKSITDSDVKKAVSASLGIYITHEQFGLLHELQHLHDTEFVEGQPFPGLPATFYHEYGIKYPV